MSSSSMFCQTATDLIRELKRSQKWLPAYNENAILEIAQECQKSWDFMKPHQEAVAAQNARLRADRAARGLPPPGPHERVTLPDDVAVTITSHLAAIKRNKRCVLAYLMHRLNALRDLWWSSGSVVAEELRAACSAKELAAHHAYDKLLTQYMSSVDLVLTSDLSPPKDLYIEVRALRDVGEIQTEAGTVQLDRDTVHLLRRTDAEMLIRQGALMQTQKE